MSHTGDDSVFVEPLTRADVARLQRARIVDVVTEVVAERGYAGTSISDIVSRGGLSRKTFYQLFDNKADAFFAAYDVGVARMLEAMRAACPGEGDAVARAGEALAALLELFEREPALARLIVVEAQTASALAGDRERHLRPLLEGLEEAFRELGADSGLTAAERAEMGLGLLRARIGAGGEGFGGLLPALVLVTTGTEGAPAGASPGGVGGAAAGDGGRTAAVGEVLDGVVKLDGVRALIVESAIRHDASALAEVRERLTGELQRRPPRVPRDRLEVLRRMAAAGLEEGPGGVLRAAGHGGGPDAESVTPQGLRVLRWILDHPGVSGREIQRGLGFGSESRVSRLTTALAGEGLIVDRSDGTRAKRWHLTADGRRAVG